MSNKTQSIKSYKIVYPQLYSYTLPNRVENNGSEKIGYTEQENVDERILQQVKTAAFTEKYTKIWSAPAFFEGGIESFKDVSFHKFLEKNGIERKVNLGREWFYFNEELSKSKDLFNLFRKEKFSALQNNNRKQEYSLRFEQEEAVKKALEYFRNNEKGEFLWNAKPRFGKTLASYDLAKRLVATKVLIVTNRPAIANSWYEDYETFIDGYSFISETSSLYNKPTITREQHISITPIKPQFTFLSLQDLKGSKYFGGNFDKLRWVADLEWDLLIIDEAHEGIDTGRTDAAFDIITRKNTLHLSGTPFKALANEKFPKEAIYNWTYLDEQKIKQIEIQEGESGDHTDMPELKLFTYRISQMITDQVNEGIEIDRENFDYAFDLNEFFRAKNQKFTRENEIKEFLRNLTSNIKYPFSTPELRNELKHTFWYVGNRVESVKALEQLLKEDPIFKEYKIIVAAGDGRTFEEEENDFKGNEKSYERVKNAIRENDKTITLSCGQLTTGVTIKEWTAVLMLTDIKTPSLYMQAAFRAQNPYKEIRNGQLLMKKSAYLFDFAPTRVLEIYDQFANGLNPKAVKGEITENEREDNIKELLNFFPVISEDVYGEMIELDAEKVLTFPNALAASEIVNARFMTNLLFNDSLKGVFNFPKEVEDILDKMPEEKNKRIQKTSGTLDLDDARKVNDSKIARINENSEIILGEKIFKTNTERVVDNLLNNNYDQISPEELVSTFTQVAEPLIAKYKEVYKATAAETNEATKQIQEKVKVVAEEYNNSGVKDAANLKQKLIDILEEDFVRNKVAEKEKEVVEKVQKTKEEEVRDRLRSFTRTIPMFIMANASKEEITIDNFDLEINDEDFEELTSITKEEFHKLRDGFDYEENDVRKSFQGVFNKYRFNASIAEFRLKKEELANYFTSVEDIFELIPNQKTNQIFTPKKVVQMMIDQLEEHDPTLFARTDSTFIDLYMKSGMYITEIVKKLFNNTRKLYESDEACLKYILENQVYGLSPTPILQGITHTYIFGFDVENNVNRKNFIQHDITPEAQKRTAKEILQKFFNLKVDMKFDAVVGNPPYQDKTVGDSTQMPPIYHLFMEASHTLSDVVCLISPARFLFNAGATPTAWNRKMLSDKHLKVIYFEQDSAKVFPNTDIKGGVAVTLRDSNKDFGAIETFTSYSELNSILKKVVCKTDRFLSEIIYSAFSYQFDETIHIEHPEVESKLSKGHKNDIFSGIFDSLSDIFTKEKPSSDEVYIKYYGLSQSKREYRWVKKSYIRNHPTLDKYKVWLPNANGSGALGEALSSPLIGEPLIGATQTFISIGAFDNIEEAERALKYIKTKFTRTMLGILKITQHNPPAKWEKVPLQDFTENSDIDFSKSISEIDQQLFKKYCLSDEEIAFIEEKVQSMD
ncbi:Eco57I restriction-modification methylase domain-containing protein [Aquirufa antheringensis]